MCNLSERIEERARIEVRAEAHAEGHAEGRAEGIMEKSLQVYKNCIARNMSEEDALAIAGLTKEQLVELQTVVK